MTDITDDQHFLFRIGPFGHNESRHYMYFLQPGDPDMPRVEAVDDKAALQELVQHFDANSLVVETAMGEAAAQFHIPARAFDDHAAHALELTRFGGHLNLSDNAPRGITWLNLRLVENVELSMISTSSKYLN